MLTEDEKDLLFDNLRININVPDIKKNNVVYLVGDEDSLPLREKDQLESSQDDSVLIDWEDQDSVDQMHVDRALRDSRSPLLDSEITTPEEDFEIVTSSRFIEIEFTLSEPNLFKIEIFTNRFGGTTSGLRVSVKEKASGKVLITKDIHNASIKDLDFTTLLFDITSAGIGFTYILTIVGWDIGADPKGISIYKKLDGTFLRRIFSGKPGLLKGQVETTTVTIIVLYHNKQPTTEPTSIEEVSGKIAAQRIAQALRLHILEFWEDLITRVELLDVSGILTGTTFDIGQYDYTYSFSVRLRYETTWLVEPIVLKSVLVTIKVK